MPDDLTTWATGLLRACPMVQARPLEQVYRIEPGCITFTVRRATGLMAMTAILKPSATPPLRAVIDHIVDGWPVVEPAVPIEAWPAPAPA